jgi:hypothetical protein
MLFMSLYGSIPTTSISFKTKKKERKRKKLSQNTIGTFSSTTCLDMLACKLHERDEKFNIKMLINVNKKISDFKNEPKYVLFLKPHIL